MEAALQAYGLSPVRTYWFNWNLKEATARRVLREIKEQGADSVLLVANSIEGAVWARAMAALDPAKQMPIISHWGITGGDFIERATLATLDRIEVSFVQPNLHPLYDVSTPFHQGVIERVERLFGPVESPARRWRSPAGFIHGYDITRLWIAAAGQANLTGSAREDRRQIRVELERLNRPVEGLLKSYDTPFQPVDQAGADAHEALSSADYIMAQFDKEGWILPMSKADRDVERHEAE